MKYITGLIIVMILSLSGCKDDEDCYELWGTKENCESNPKCRFTKTSFEILLENSKVVNLDEILRRWGANVRDLMIGLCLQKDNRSPSYGDEWCTDNLEDTDERPLCSHNYYFLRFGNNFFTFQDLRNPPSSDWEESDNFPNVTMLSECGNGIIEPSEQCDGTQLGSMADCATHGHLLGKGPWTSGNIKCSDTCHWDYTDCQ